MQAPVLDQHRETIRENPPGLVDAFSGVMQSRAGLAKRAGSHLDAEGFAAQRCTGLFMMIAGGLADSESKKTVVRQGEIFLRLGDAHPEKDQLRIGRPPRDCRRHKPMVQAYVTRANEQRARTGNCLGDPVINADAQWCKELLQ